MNNMCPAYRIEQSARRIEFVGVVILASLVSSNISAQEFSIKQVEMQGDQLALHYDLIDTVKNHTYSIYVYSSRDNFLNALEKITGDAGLEVKPGRNRKIVWNAKEELGPAFVGEVELEIRGRVYIPFIRFEGFQDVEVRKRGVPFLVKWSGGTRQNILNFQLYQDGKLKYTFPNAPNNAEQKITIPTTVKPGNGYYFRISDTKNKDQVVITPAFEIKRKYPLALKAVPVLLIGGVIYFLLPDPLPDPLEGPPGTPTETN
jgi:hypothetical protein